MFLYIVIWQDFSVSKHESTLKSTLQLEMMLCIQNKLVAKMFCGLNTFGYQYTIGVGGHSATAYSSRFCQIMQKYLAFSLKNATFARVKE